MSEHSRPPGILVSSTFYDLRQIREDLRRFLQDDLGYRPLLSEHPSFPIEPDATTVENCRQRVEHDADVLVLVVGRRYGSIDAKTSASVTNLEYLAARHKGIPVYAFTDSGLLTLLPVWLANPSADFSREVDSPKVFDFIQQIRSVDKVWMQEFRQAQDIIDALRIQLAYQHQRGLNALRRLRTVGDRDWLEDLRGETLRIALDRPPMWEFLLFASALTDAVVRHRRLRRRHELHFGLGPGEDVRDPLEWLGDRFRDAQRFGAAATELFNTTLQQALGPEGTSGDAERILFVAETVGDIYRDSLEWAERIRTANIDEQFDRLRSIVARMLDDLIEPVQEFGPRIRGEIEAALSAPRTDEPRVLEMTLTVAFPAGVLEEFNAELARLARG